jgi:hypothetical protein
MHVRVPLPSARYDFAGGENFSNLTQEPNDGAPVLLRRLPGDFLVSILYLLPK